MTINSDNSLNAVWLNQEEYKEWDAFVDRHPLGLVYHTSAWKNAIEGAFSHIKGYFLALRSEDNGKIAAGIPVYSVRSWLLGNRIVSIPYASICDPLISSPVHFQLLLQKIIALQKETSSKFIEIRTVNTTGFVENSNACDQTNYLHHYLPLDESLDNIKKSLPYDNMRRVINRAHRNRLVVKTETGKDSIRYLYKILLSARKRLCLPPLPSKLFYSFDQSFSSERMTIFFALKNHRKIAYLLALNFNGIMHVEYSGGTIEAYKVGASHLLHWEAIRNAHEIGCKRFSFGRTSLDNSGLLSFKRRWNTVEESVVINHLELKSKSVKSFEKGRDTAISRLVFGKAPGFVREAFASIIYHHHG